MKVARRMNLFYVLIYLNCIGVFAFASSPIATNHHSHDHIHGVNQTKPMNNSTKQVEIKMNPSNRFTAKDDGAKHRGHIQYSTNVNKSPMIPNNGHAITHWRRIFQPMIIANAFQCHNICAASALDSVSTQLDQNVNTDISPPCNISTEQVMDVIKRMKTDQCKLEASTIPCLYRDVLLYPKWLPRNCPAKAPAAGQYPGCYSFNITSIASKPYNLSNNTPQRCMDLCLQHGYPLSGVGSGYACFCGNNAPNERTLLPETSCNMTCAGDGNQTCGGQTAMKVYRTGISALFMRKIVDTTSILSDPSGPRVKILYFIALSGRSVRQVKRLFKALYHSTETYFSIHVDSRQDYMFYELLPLEERFPNVRLCRYRRSTIWGGSSILDVQLRCMEEVFSLTDWDWDYFLNLSESDFPIKTHEKLIVFLTANNGSNYSGHRRNGNRGFVRKHGLVYMFLECENRMWKIGNRTLPSGIEFDVGSDWFGLTRSLVQYAVQDVGELVTGLKRLYNYTLMPTESFFPTLLANSIFCQTSTQRNLRHINWKPERYGCMQGHIVDWCGRSPCAFTLEDWPKLRATESKNAFIARKFTPLINQAIVNHVDSWVYGVQPDLPGWTSYWENEFHSDSTSPPVESEFYTVYASLGRLSEKLLNSLMPENINLTTNRILEVTLYNDDDIFRGTLVLFEVVGHVSSEKVVLETRAMPDDFYEVFDVNEPVGRLKSMKVGSEYNEIDYTFRNLGRIFGPHSILGVRHQWIDGEPLNVSFVWIDPTDTVAEVMEVEIPVGKYTGHKKLNVSQPLRPGVWTLKLLHDWKTVAERSFLVVPLSHNGTSPITAIEAEVVNGGLVDKIRYTDANFSDVEKMLSFEDQQDAELRFREAQHNGKLFGSKLLDWIDGLVEMFYDIQDLCFVETSVSPLLQPYIFDAMTPCRLVSWSSRSIDPKSDLGKVNKFTGRFER